MKQKKQSQKDRLESLLKRQPKSGSFFVYMIDLISKLDRFGQKRTSETYTSALCSFADFRDGKDVTMKDITPALIQEYEAYLKAKGLVRNSSSFYMRILRAAYNRAVDDGVIADKRPFKRVYTGTDKTAKRALDISVIKKIKCLDLSGKPSLDFARDIFMFSFYTRGMSFVDIAYLKKSDLKNGVLSYRRRKTGQQLFIKWEKSMREIVDKYKTGSSVYLLPLINSCESGDERKQYRNKMFLVNANLKKVGLLAGLGVNLTSYMARHSWASIAKSKNIPISVISEGMGHDNEKTTQIYLAQLDNSQIDKANELILKAI